MENIKIYTSHKNDHSKVSVHPQMSLNRKWQIVKESNEHHDNQIRKEKADKETLILQITTIIIIKHRCALIKADV